MIIEKRKPTNEEMSILKDLCQKAMEDVRQAIDTTLDLARETAGVSGIFVIAQGVAGTLAVGAAMSIATMRNGKPPKSIKDISDDDLLFSALMAACQYKDNPLTSAQKMFEKLTGKRHDTPFAPTND